MFFCGLDVSLRETAICIVDADGKIMKELKVASDPNAIANAIRDSGFVCEIVGLELVMRQRCCRRGCATNRIEMMRAVSRN